MKKSDKWDGFYCGDYFYIRLNNTLMCINVFKCCKMYITL